MKIFVSRYFRYKNAYFEFLFLIFQILKMRQKTYSVTLILISGLLISALYTQNNAFGLWHRHEFFSKSRPKTLIRSQIPLKNMFGVNGYEWNFLQNPGNPNDGSKIYAPKMARIIAFTQFRHYMDWSKIEQKKGEYTFNPTFDGGWNYDIIYKTARQDSILMLADLKTCPPWLGNSYPANLRNSENVPAPYGLNRSYPASYILQAKAAFQLAARYGSNKNVPGNLVSACSRPRWHADPPNEVKIGLGVLKYIECDNERDKWWKGPQAQQSAEEYAANMSAFYDGDKGKLGKGVGVKAADPGMQVVMGGLAKPHVQFVKDMIAWCKKHRGYRKDGSVDLCFDVINYHKYANDGSDDKPATVGVAPELAGIGKIADGFVTLANSLPQHPQVWVTENGYDINPGSLQRAIAIGNKTALLTQADWAIRSCFLYMRHGISRLFYYQLFDDSPNSPGTYGTSGVINEDLTRRPIADYMVQVKNLMGNYTYDGTISLDPLVDRYVLGHKTIYALMIPDEKGRTGKYILDLGKAKTATIYSLKVGSDVMDKAAVKTNRSKLMVNVSETPVFVKGE